MTSPERSSKSLSRRNIFEASFSGAQERPPIPRLRSDPPITWQPPPQTLNDIRRQEGERNREVRLRALWSRLPTQYKDVEHDENLWSHQTSLDDEQARRLWAMYENELRRSCSSQGVSSRITWQDFVEYADKKEKELWRIFHTDLDLDNNGHLDANELAVALKKAGIILAPTTLTEFMTFLTSSRHSHAISFPEFRDFLLLLARPASPKEIFRYYEVRKFLGDDGRGSARINMEGDVSLSAEDRPPDNGVHFARFHEQADEGDDFHLGHHENLEIDEGNQSWIFGQTSRYLLAGGVAGAALHISPNAPAPIHGLRVLTDAVTKLYVEGGIRSFWVGNGLNLIKIFPESAMKFMTYEQTKRLFARHWDHVEDSRNISGTSRFISGGIGGITSQLFIYPIETLKTQMMSSTSSETRTISSAMRRLWKLKGFRAFYRGLTKFKPTNKPWLGVFPYSAIDMSTFEALKLAYLRSTGKEEPGVMAILAFGSISGSIGATSVYPLNLVRTRLQASGSPGHPQQYTGVWDVVSKTMSTDGVRGFYRGLFPTLAKVVPSVSISYVVYENTKRKLGVS
ncbi:hypothetical protein Clacol_001822 [Clathrus columnatus]|uniref:EF-hand domain-containing protein n=1 Tax=Clathrus columnatus TaxID=1419009 RepID=A0AAV5A4N7_9AGAM|nr:hypothetical protein Clacol_001822 [Clathrus columnatus]